MKTDILKLIFHHDQRLDKLAKRNANKTREEVEASLEDFMKPDPTYSRFYFTGTDLAAERFGLNVLSNYQKVVASLEEAFQNKKVFTQQQPFRSLSSALEAIDTGEVVILTEAEEIGFDITDLHIDESSNVGHLKEELKEALEADHLVMYKEQAKDGFDLHLFSKKNVYRKMFFPLQQLVPEHFRFFSINGKKSRSERHFYFETWTLDKPPHGFEEVFPESVL